MTASGTANRAYSAAHFALALDGNAAVGLFKSVEGGNIKTELIKYQNGAQHPTFLRLGKPKYDDIKVQVGMAMSAPFYQWIEKFFAGEPVRKTGAIIAADFYYRERARRDFDQAMITEVTFPKLDGGDKGAVYMGVTISPETITYAAGSGAAIVANDGFEKQKLWAACHFKFRLDGFEDACRRVTKVDSFTIKQKAIEYAQGGLRAPIKVPGRMEYPNLAFYVPEADAQPFVDYHTRRVINGELQADARMHGVITTHDNKGEDLFELEFWGSEIFAVTHDKSDASSEEIKQVKVELCIEKMKFTYR